MLQNPIEIPEGIPEKWQNIVDILAQLIDIPTALIMRIVEADLEVFSASQSEDNPYKAGFKEELVGSGFYCETVLRTQKRLAVPNALTDEAWKNNPDVKLGLISYLGFPLLFPDGVPFGTICILDKKENAFPGKYEKLIAAMRDIIQGQLELIYMNDKLGTENQTLSDYLEEIQLLRGITPICCFCKKIRDEDGLWEPVDVYVEKRSAAEFSHGFCPDCAKEHYGDFADEE
jgi:GAF domain-containing protein